MTDFINVLVLAGGEATRFWPISHKLLLPLNGRNLLDWQLDGIRKAGFENIILVANKNIKSHFWDNDVKIVEQVGSGQASAILSVADIIKDKPVLIVNADDWINHRLYSQVLREIHNDSNLLVGYKSQKYFPGGYLVLEDKKVAKIVEKPKEGTEPSSFVKLVFDLVINTNDLINAITSLNNISSDNRYEAALSRLISRGVEFKLLEYSDKWLPVKYPWHWLFVMEEFLSTINKTQISSKAKIDKTAIIKGPVVIEERVRIMEYAKLVGPMYIGAGSIVGNHTLVRSSMIGENCVIGFGSDISRSYIGNNCWFHSNYVGDSLIDNDVSLGAGAVLANLRLDEGSVYSEVKGNRVNTHRSKLGSVLGEGVRVGIEAQLMPGVKVGKNSVVGPGIILKDDLSDNKRCYLTHSYEIRENLVSNIRSRERFRKQI